ncbi:hypothetical protein ACRE4W_001611 [Enterococcus hirae]|nr:hypothetical protein [Enterococcus hirae]EMF0438739.1 hypothetical protein [Enterococcus hirae]MCI5921888.1 hypothetical protein [Enterococcus hirae]MDL4901251.1 hypothetical protein [Enterococcus hirae]MDL4941063.1 hypothetical protein [Enterococcus hirae]MEE1498947.1 hypothetical protein [Enterococcus hirae]
MNPMIIVYVGSFFFSFIFTMIWQNYLVSVILVLFDLYHETICLTIIAMLVANDLILVSPNS